MPRNKRANGQFSDDQISETVREKRPTESIVDPFADNAPWRDARWRARLRRRVRSWFDANSRSLPWRRTNDPYLIWISEVMLQQTQVATVIPYFECFRESFPTPHDLAAADEADVLRHWEGLGYYRRARQLHAAAKVIVAEHEGRFPLRFDDVLALPGIGRYTAGAILSISADQSHPVVEANTQRLYSRLMALRMPPTEKQANALLWEFAAEMLPRKAVGRFNQAMMELGSLVCRPRDPKCPECPLRPLCAAYQHGLEASIPGKIKKLTYEDRAEFALLVRRAPSAGAAATDAAPTYFVYQVPAGRRWGGLWDFPRYGGSEIGNPEQAAERARADFGLRFELGPRLTTIRHGVTRYRITLDAYRADCRDSRQANQTQKREPLHSGRWLTVVELADLPLSVTGRKLVERLAADEAGATGK